MASAEAEEVIRQNRALQRTWAELGDATFREFRASYDDYLAGFHIREDATFDEILAGGVRTIRVRVPGASADRLVLHAHSGGYVIGSVEGYKAFGADLAAACGCEVWLVAYGRAPERPAPAALADFVRAFQWAIEEGRAADEIVFCGDSAGGGLVLAAMQELNDIGGLQPACGIAISPWTDLTCDGDSFDTNAERDPLVSRELLQGLVGLVVGRDGDPTDPRVSPLRGDWEGLAPLLIMASDMEVLRDDATRAADAARAAGVDVTLNVVEDMVHVWPINADRLAEARTALTQIGVFVAQHTAAGASSGR